MAKQVKYENIDTILSSPITRFFVAEVYNKAINRDIVDSIHDMELVLSMLKAKFLHDKYNL